MFADCCSLFFEHCPHTGQRQLLEDAFHLFWWVGHRSLDPPFEQGEKGPGQVLGDHWQRDRRRTFFCTQGSDPLYCQSTMSALPGQTQPWLTASSISTVAARRPRVEGLPRHGAAQGAFRARPRHTHSRGGERQSSGSSHTATGLAFSQEKICETFEHVKKKGIP
jgi:hypothetical protein